MPQSTLCWTDIPVADLDRAIAFYSVMLGAEVSKQTMGDFSFGMLPQLGEGPVGCLATMENNAPSQTGPLVYLSADGRLDAAAEAVGTHGGAVLQPKHPIGPYGFRVVVLDSEGNRIALHSHTA